MDNEVPIELRVVGQVPCDVLCKPSINLGREYLDPLRDFDFNLYKIVIEEIGKPRSFLNDRLHHFTINELEHSSVKDSVKIKLEEFLYKVKKADIEAKEILLSSIQTCPNLYLADFIRLWWIAVDPGNNILLCDANTGEIKNYKKDENSNIVDLRIYRYKKINPYTLVCTSHTKLGFPNLVECKNNYLLFYIIKYILVFQHMFFKKKEVK